MKPVQIYTGLIFYSFPAVENILYLIETPFNTYANRADSDQAALVRTACSRSINCLWKFKYDISDHPTLVDVTSYCLFNI